MPLKGRVNVTRAIVALKESANDDVTGVYLAGLKEIIQQTPALHGAARNSWRLSKAPNGEFDQSAENTSGSASIASIANNMPANVLGEKLYFVNEAPYINLLEYGGYPKNVKKGSYLDGKYQIMTVNGFSKPVAPSGWVRENIKLMAKKIKTL